MFEIIVGISIISLYVVLFSFIPVMFSLRLSEVLVKKIALKKALLILLLPFSSGYFYLLPGVDVHKRIYRTVSVIYFVLTFFAAFFVFYMQKAV